MIHEVDGVLRKLIASGPLSGSDIEVTFDAPTREWAARRNAPTIDAYLYDIREDVKLRQRGHTLVRDERDVVVKRRQPPRWFRLSYLVTAWTTKAEDEHRLLAAVLATLLPRELLPPSELPGPLGELGLTVPMSVASLQTEARSLAEIWSALGGELKPSVDVVITVPFPAYPEYDAGPPVTEGAEVRVHSTTGEPAEPEARAHRPHQVAAARRARAVEAAGTTESARTSKAAPASEAAR